MVVLDEVSWKNRRQDLSKEAWTECNAHRQEKWLFLKMGYR